MSGGGDGVDQVEGEGERRIEDRGLSVDLEKGGAAAREEAEELGATFPG